MKPNPYARQSAPLYGVEIRTLNQAVKQNIDRFPADFMFQLAWEEVERSRSQSVILDTAAAQALEAGTSSSNPMPSEQDVAMLSRPAGI